MIMGNQPARLRSSRDGRMSPARGSESDGARRCFIGEQASTDQGERPMIRKLSLLVVVAAMGALVATPAYAPTTENGDTLVNDINIA